jgi:hypothetical protein
MVSDREGPTKISGVNCLIRLAASIKEKAMKDNKSLKLKWVKSEWHLFTVYTNQSGMLPNN